MTFPEETKNKGSGTFNRTTSIARNNNMNAQS